MAPNVPDMGLESSGCSQKIGTFAVLDLETTNLPAYKCNKTSIIEICVYAFDSGILKCASNLSYIKNKVDEDKCVLPLDPRVLHKLNLYFQPSLIVEPFTEQATGLSNYLLERETKLNENAAQTILSFLKHLPAPVCLVAHNGWQFDFPIIKQAFEKLDMQLSPDIICVDSLRAFLEIDEMRKELESKVQPNDERGQEVETIDWQAVNETTPKRPINTRAEAAAKRKRLANDEQDSNQSPSPTKCHARRQLFSNMKCAQTKRFPPKGVYKLGQLYKSTFNSEPVNAHQAEADVKMLLKLIQYYGEDFLDFAKHQAIPFADIKPPGWKRS